MKAAMAAAFCSGSVTKQLTSAVSVFKCQDCVYPHKRKATDSLLALMTAMAFKRSFSDQSGLQQNSSVRYGSTSEFHQSLAELSIFLSEKLFKTR